MNQQEGYPRQGKQTFPQKQDSLGKNKSTGDLFKQPLLKYPILLRREGPY
jgi:hypothetical protein